MCGWEKRRGFRRRCPERPCHHGDKAMDSIRVSAVVIGSAGRGGGVWAVVIFAQRCGVVRGGVHVCLLKRRREVVGPLVRQQIVLIQSLELHGCVFFILWCGVSLVVEVVGCGGVDDGRLL